MVSLYTPLLFGCVKKNISDGVGSQHDSIDTPLYPPLFIFKMEGEGEFEDGVETVYVSLFTLQDLLACINAIIYIMFFSCCQERANV
jgi:hypothetical protein